MVTSDDFENGPLSDLGVTVSHIPVTETQNNVTGDRDFSDGTATDIQAVFTNPTIIYDLENRGEQENSEVIAAVKGDVDITKGDKLTWKSYVFRVESISPRYFGENIIHKKLVLTLITPA